MTEPEDLQRAHDTARPHARTAVKTGRAVTAPTRSWLRRNVKHVALGIFAIGFIALVVTCASGT